VSDFLSLYWLVISVSALMAGFINTLAGNGSTITFSVLNAVGLSSSVANGTNRVGILAQSITISWQYVRASQKNFSNDFIKYVFPVLLGACLGAFIAVLLPPKTLSFLVGFLMLFLFFAAKIAYKIRKKGTENKWSNSKRLLFLFFTGIYGGFFQAGVGLWLMVCLLFTSTYSVQYINLLKAFIVCIFTVPSLFIFVYFDQVYWKVGLVMSFFQIVGAVFASKIKLKTAKSLRILEFFVLATIAFSALYLFYQSFFL